MSGCVSTCARISSRGSRSATVSRSAFPRLATSRSRSRSAPSPRGANMPAGARPVRPADLRGPRLSAPADSRFAARHERLRGLARGTLMRPLGPGLLCVATREVLWIWRDRIALLLVVAIPLAAFAILAATFSHAVIRDLKVDVVDQDRSQTSMTYVQAINAAASVTVAQRSSDLSGAMHAVRSGKALATVYIPMNLERDIGAGRRPQIVIFYNKQYFTPGNIASRGLETAISAATAALPRTHAATSSFTPGPLVVEQYVLTNPALNYAQFLLRAILPTVLHIVVAIAAGYAVGSEFGSRNLGEWLEAAGGDPLTALVGKLAPYFGIFVLLLVAAGLTIHRGYEVPFRGSAALTGAAGCLLIVGYLSIGALLQLLARN